MTITPPDYGDTNWNVQVDQLFDYVNDMIGLPDPEQGTGGGFNTFAAGTGTANVWFDLPTNPVAVSITNPHATKSMVIMIGLGAWLITATSGVDVRFGARISGDLTVASGPNLSAVSPPGWGFVPLNANPSASVSFAATYSGIVPADSTLTFTGQSFFSSTTGSKSCNYATIDLVPIRYVG